MARGSRLAPAKCLLSGVFVVLVFSVAALGQQVFDGSIVARNGNIFMQTDSSICCAPEIHFNALNGAWLMGIDVANGARAQDFVPVAKIKYCQPSNPSDCSPMQTGPYTQYRVDDLIYIHNGGANPPTIGLGVTPPDESYRVQITGQDNFPSMGILKLRRGPNLVGNVLAVADTGGNTQWYIDSHYNTYTSGNIYAGGSFYAATNMYAAGDLSVTGSVTLSGGRELKIDDPVDPANKFLYHAAVQSSDMMNIYSGNAILDRRGEAEVSLPDWFEALNENFRYQLTCIGGSAPVYISQEIRNHRFRIAGGKPGLKVSWLVTGSRHDAYAQTHPTVVEEEKPLAERGRYLHPELFGGSSAPAIVSSADNSQRR